MDVLNEEIHGGRFRPDGIQEPKGQFIQGKRVYPKWMEKEKKREMVEEESDESTKKNDFQSLK